MLKNFFIVVEQVSVLFLLAGVGFILGKKGWLDDKCAGQLSQLLIYVVAPCAIIDALQITYSEKIVSTLLFGCFFLIFQYVALILISHFSFQREPPQRRSVLQFAQVYANNIFMGIPLLQAVLGTEATIFVVPSLVIFQIFQWTHGVRILGGRLSLKQAIFNPGIIGVVIGLSLFFLQIRLATVPASVTGFLADMNTPLAMIIIGVQMAQIDFHLICTHTQIYWVSIIRLLLSPLITLLIMFPFCESDPDLFFALVILSAAPVASVTPIFAQKYGKDATIAACAVTLSTLFSILTLPIFAALARMLAS